MFGETEVADAAEVLRNWDQIKRTEAGREPGIFGEVPENLPALLHARKLQRRVASTGFDFPGVEGPLAALADELAELELAVSRDGREQRFHELGDVLFAAVNLSRKLHLDPELALRAASERFRDACRRRPSWPHPTGEAGTISRPSNSSRTTPAPA